MKIKVLASGTITIQKLLSNIWLIINMHPLDSNKDAKLSSRLLKPLADTFFNVSKSNLLKSNLQTENVISNIITFQVVAYLVDKLSLLENRILYDIKHIQHYLYLISCYCCNYQHILTDNWGNIVKDLKFKMSSSSQLVKYVTKN